VKITIDAASIEHPYVQVANQLRRGIETGEIGPQLPSIMELTVEICGRIRYRLIPLLTC
jgi:DNA-binding transcriptional regulator YhcF (GntR family)